MEHMAGGEVRWRNGQNEPLLRVDQARLIARDVISGLEYLHGNGIIHRDIKPANLLWTDATYSRVKITDFGVSHSGMLPIRSEESGSTPNGHERQEHHDLAGVDQGDLARSVGSPAIIAPELCLTDRYPLSTAQCIAIAQGASWEADDHKGEEIWGNSGCKEASCLSPAFALMSGQAIDVWALGVTLYCLLFGALPFTSASEFGLFSVIPWSDYIIRTRMGLDGVLIGPRGPRWDPNQVQAAVQEHEHVSCISLSRYLHPQEVLADDGALHVPRTQQSLLPCEAEVAEGMLSPDVRALRMLLDGMLEKDPLMRWSLERVKGNEWFTGGRSLDTQPSSQSGLVGLVSPSHEPMGTSRYSQEVPTFDAVARGRQIHETSSSGRGTGMDKLRALSLGRSSGLPFLRAGRPVPPSNFEPGGAQRLPQLPQSWHNSLGRSSALSFAANHPIGTGQEIIRSQVSHPNPGIQDDWKTSAASRAHVDQADGMHRSEMQKSKPLGTLVRAQVDRIRSAIRPGAQSGRLEQLGAVPKRGARGNDFALPAPEKDMHGAQVPDDAQELLYLPESPKGGEWETKKFSSLPLQRKFSSLSVRSRRGERTEDPQHEPRLGNNRRRASLKGIFSTSSLDPNTQTESTAINHVSSRRLGKPSFENLRSNTRAAPPHLNLDLVPKTKIIPPTPTPTGGDFCSASAGGTDRITLPIGTGHKHGQGTANSMNNSFSSVNPIRAASSLSRKQSKSAAHARRKSLLDQPEQRETERNGSHFLHSDPNTIQSSNSPLSGTSQQKAERVEENSTPSSSLKMALANHGAWPSFLQTRERPTRPALRKSSPHLLLLSSRSGSGSGSGDIDSSIPSTPTYSTSGLRSGLAYADAHQSHLYKVASQQGPHSAPPAQPTDLAASHSGAEVQPTRAKRKLRTIGRQTLSVQAPAAQERGKAGPHTASTDITEYGMTPVQYNSKTQTTHYAAPDPCEVKKRHAPSFDYPSLSVNGVLTNRARKRPPFKAYAEYTDIPRENEPPSNVGKAWSTGQTNISRTTSSGPGRTSLRQVFGLQPKQESVQGSEGGLGQESIELESEQQLEQDSERGEYTFDTSAPALSSAAGPSTSFLAPSSSSLNTPPIDSSGVEEHQPILPFPQASYTSFRPHTGEMCEGAANACYSNGAVSEHTVHMDANVIPNAASNEGVINATPTKNGAASCAFPLQSPHGTNQAPRDASLHICEEDMFADAPDDALESIRASWEEQFADAVEDGRDESTSFPGGWGDDFAGRAHTPTLWGGRNVRHASLVSVLGQAGASWHSVPMSSGPSTAYGEASWQSSALPPSSPLWPGHYASSQARHIPTGSSSPSPSYSPGFSPGLGPRSLRSSPLGLASVSSASLRR